jgi:hypothetical protein
LRGKELSERVKRSITDVVRHAALLLAARLLVFFRHR